MDVKFKGETIATMNLVANNNVARSDVEYYIEKAKDEFDKPWFKECVLYLPVRRLIRQCDRLKLIYLQHTGAAEPLFIFLAGISQIAFLKSAEADYINTLHQRLLA